MSAKTITRWLLLLVFLTMVIGFIRTVIDIESAMPIPVESNTAVVNHTTIHVPAAAAAAATVQQMNSSAAAGTTSSTSTSTSSSTNTAITANSMKIQWNVQLMHPSHHPIYEKTFGGNANLDLRYFMTDADADADAEEEADHDFPSINNLMSDLLVPPKNSLNTSNDNNNNYDWYMACTSSTHVDLHKFQDYVTNVIATTKPVYIVTSACHIWNKSAHQFIIKRKRIYRWCGKLTESRDRPSQIKYIHKCLLKLKRIRTIQYEHPKNVTCVTTTNHDWMLPNILNHDRYVPIVPWLMLEHEHFRHKHDCRCATSAASQRIQKLELPACEIQKVKLPKTTTMTAVPAYVISAYSNQTKQRMEGFMPAPFVGTVIDAVMMEFGKGTLGIRQSMKKALQQGLLQNNSDLFLIMEDDFRFAKSFDWNLLHTNKDTCFHGTLSDGGVLLFGFTVWTQAYWRHLNAKNEIYDDGQCVDATRYMYGAFAALYTREAAEFALWWLEVTPDTRSYDWLWADMVDAGRTARGLLKPLVVADLDHPSTTNPYKFNKTGTVMPIQQRHDVFRWGVVEDFVPPSGAFPDPYKFGRGKGKKM